MCVCKYIYMYMYMCIYLCMLFTWILQPSPLALVINHMVLNHMELKHNIDIMVQYGTKQYGAQLYGTQSYGTQTYGTLNIILYDSIVSARHVTVCFQFLYAPS